MIHRENYDNIVLLRIEHGKVNAIDAELFQDLQVRFQELRNENSPPVILTGAGSSFSAGVDLFRVLNGGKSYIQGFLPLLSTGLEELFLYPGPMVAAVNGHAIAGGCIIACCGDYRLMARGSARIGVPELLVGVPFPPIALEIMRFSVSNTHISKVVYTGKYYSAEEGLHRGMVDEIVDPGQLIDRALEVVRQLAGIPPDSFRITKQQIRTPSFERARNVRPAASDLIDIWSSAEIHSVIRNYLQKTVRKGG